MPNDLLVVPHLYLDQETGDTVSNATAPDLLIDSLQDVEKDKMAMFGSIFFSVAYLSANYDTGKFTLWRANRSPDAVEDMRTIDADGEDHMSFCDAETADINATSTDSEGDTDTTGGTDSASGTDSAGDTTESTAADGRLATGAIAGIAVGVVGAVAVVIGGLAWWFLRRRRKAAASEAAELEDSVKKGPPPQGTPYDGTPFAGTLFHVTPFNGTPRPELPDQSAHKYELPVSGPPVYAELPGQRY